jgi:tetratricopeptide (TPR) repeat protein
MHEFPPVRNGMPLMSEEIPESLDPTVYLLWEPTAGRSVAAGADRHAVPLPEAPLPIYRNDLAEGEPSDEAIGQAIYDYLRHFPDCPHNRSYVELLRDAYPHFLADLGAHILMLDNKEVDAPYIRRKLVGLKILALLDPENPGLLQQMGIACYDLGLSFTELETCRHQLLEGMGYFLRALKHSPENPLLLNYLGQIDYLFGDYPAVARRWRKVIDLLEDGPQRQDLKERLESIAAGKTPGHPLVDDLEGIGEAMALAGSGDFHGARSILDHLEEAGVVPSELPSAEFYYLLGLCRARTGDAAGAFAALEEALALQPDHPEALAEKDRILEGSA